MKKIVLVFMLFLGMNSLFGQAQSQLNFGIIGASWDFPVAEDVSIAPFARTGLNMDWLVVGGKVDYYFDNLMGLPAEWDVYGGANIGYVSLLNNNLASVNALFLGLEVGARYFWNEKWGVNLELGGGAIGVIPGIGITMKL